MRVLFFCSLMMSVLFSFNASAAISMVKKLQIENRISLYNLGVLNSEESFSSIQEGCISPDTSACMIFVCGSYPSYDERLRAARACSANFGKECAVFVAGSYPSFDERVKAAQSCAGNYNLECAKFVAGSYPSFDERAQAASACRNADLACTKTVAGSYPSFSERVEAAKACGGQI